jgi:hypothetical protein
MTLRSSCLRVSIGSRETALREGNDVAAEEMGGYLLLAGYAVLFYGAIRFFGLRRVLVLLVMVGVAGLVMAFKTLAGVTSARRW